MIEISSWINDTKDMNVRDVYNMMKEAIKEGNDIVFLNPADLEDCTLLNWEDGVALVYITNGEDPTLEEVVKAFIKELEEN